MPKKTGGTRTRNHEVNENVEFPFEYAKQMAEYLRPHYSHLPKYMNILDACSGGGNLGQSFLSHSNGIVCYYVDKFNGQDIHEIDDGKYELIVCNPPWSIKTALPIYNKLLTLLSYNGILFFIINNVFCYQGSSRAEILKYQKYYFLPRWVFKPSGRPLLDCGVMVYHKNNIIPRDAVLLPPYIPLKRMVT